MQILQLEKHLKDQQVVRGALEIALGPNAAPVNLSYENPMPKVTSSPNECCYFFFLFCNAHRCALILQAANELIREIATLELEVKNMEQYLLTLYRQAFEQQAPVFSPPGLGEAPKPSMSSRSGQLQETPNANASCRGSGDAMLRSSYPPPPSRKKWNDPLTDCSTSACSDRPNDSDVLRCQSALSYRGVRSSRISPSEESLARALRSCHSQPFSFLEVSIFTMIRDMLMLGHDNLAML
jgi:hypothetical protein